LNLDSHAIRKTRVVETETGETLCRFDREPHGVSGKWQVDIRRGDGGGWIFVGDYERYEWARQRGIKGEEQFVLVCSTFSRTKSRRRKSSATLRPSLDDTAPEQVFAKITLLPKSPPMVLVVPRKGRGDGREFGALEEVEMVNKEEVLNVLIQGLWIVWREGVVEDFGQDRRNSWAPAEAGRKRSWMDIFFCRN
jgi:hypothetical protein